MKYVISKHYELSFSYPFIYLTQKMAKIKENCLF